MHLSDLARRLGEPGEAQVGQLARLAVFFGDKWMAAREVEALTSTVPSVVRRRDGGERTLGARFFRVCRRACWKAYQRGELASREAIAWFFDPTTAPPPGELRGDGKRRRRTHGGKKKKKAPTQARAPRQVKPIADWARPTRSRPLPTPGRTSCEPRLPPIPIGPPRQEPHGKRVPRHLAPPPEAEVYVIRRPTVARSR